MIPELGPIAVEPTALIFLLGMRHGLDPDHVAMIDGLTMRAIAAGRPGAGWIGTWFSLGHSLAVGAVAVMVAVLSARLVAPDWLPAVIDWLVIALLLLVGTLNLQGLLRRTPNTLRSLPERALPSGLRGRIGPLPTIAIGILFGLVFDTASQAAAWGAAATATGGVEGAIVIAAAFAMGMMLVDTIDSQLLARLARTGRAADQLTRWRRAATWVIVVLSFGTAGLALLEKLGFALSVPDSGFTAIGLLAALAVVVLLARERYRSQQRRGEG